jgi:hypothetical protein
LVKSSNREGLLAIHSQLPIANCQLPIGKQIIVVYLNPCDNQLVLPWRKFSSQYGSIEK